MKVVKFDERWDRDKIKACQLRLLKKQMIYVWERSRFYQKRFREAGLSLSDIKTLKDLEKIPLTAKEDLKNYYDDFVCTAKEDVVDYCATSGTTGKPLLIPHTLGDWRISIEYLKEQLQALGIRKGDVVQQSMAFDQLFPVCIFYDTALKELGITSLRVGPGNSKRQIELMLDVGTTVIVAIPDYMLVLADTAREMGFNPARDFKLRKGLLVTQNLYTRDWKPNALKKKIEETWAIDTLSAYGATEPKMGIFECVGHGGHHVPPQLFIVEIIDPETQRALGPEEEGELVFTNLAHEAMPILRLRQGDISYLKTDTCPCGSNAPRVMTILGRTDQMMKIKGVSLYPTQIEEILIAIPEISNFIIEAFSDERGQDRLKIKASLAVREANAVQKIQDEIKSKARLKPEVEICPADQIEALQVSLGTRKMKKFWDRRKSK